MSKECKHYSNHCTLFAPCCQKYYDCKRCHNESNEHILSGDGDIKIRCDYCGFDQKIRQTCEKCTKSLGEYYCEQCIIFENDLTRGIFHCDECKMCRLGGRENFFHCETCSCCLNVSTKSTHKCIQQILGQNCPVCLENLNSSNITTSFFLCGHPIHSTCLQEFMKQNYKCPTCRKSIFPQPILDPIYELMEQEILATPMPDEYKDKKVNIICNDCGAKSETLFHIFGHKCQPCGSFNTDRTDDS
ncbi:MAG: CHY zinc finger family protein [Harvfovirus sp.]|uniref:CHY zinc finger family protein n=1 Tax=Harvfovirus sp. TaxID=2487768 RepID=A0A3G5A1K6_9VIRU|nr:MAG: CHY zinc finger family protein [Harvfovirus sp.]